MCRSQDASRDIFLYIFYQLWETFEINVNLASCFSAGAEEFSCDSINYFPTEEYRPDQQDSTPAIPCK